MNTQPKQTPCSGAVETREGEVRPRFSTESTPEQLEIRIELPGVPKAEVSVEWKESVLTVRGRRRRIERPEARYLHRESGAGDYRLQLQIGREVDATRVNASMADGVLRVGLPHRAAAQPLRVEVA